MTFFLQEMLLLKALTFVYKKKKGFKVNSGNIKYDMFIIPPESTKPLNFEMSCDSFQSYDMLCIATSLCHSFDS